MSNRQRTACYTLVHTDLLKHKTLAAIRVPPGVEIGFTRSIVSLVGTNLSCDTDKNNNEAVTQSERKEDGGQRLQELTRDISRAENRQWTRGEVEQITERSLSEVRGSLYHRRYKDSRKWPARDRAIFPLLFLSRTQRAGLASDSYVCALAAGSTTAVKGENWHPCWLSITDLISGVTSLSTCSRPSVFNGPRRSDLSHCSLIMYIRQIYGL